MAPAFPNLPAASRPFKQNPDVIIVGAGPAGSTAAIILARAGANVLLLEKARFPRDKVCGDAVGLDGVRVLRRLGLIEKVRVAGAISVRGVKFSSPSGICASIRLPEERVKEIGFVLPRIAFDQLLFSSALEAGAHALETFRVHSPLLAGDQIVGVVGIHDQKSVSIRAPLVIAADGVHSVFRRHLRIRASIDGARVFALRSYYRGVQDLGDNIEIHYVDGMLPAFGWIFPTGADCANVGVGAWAGRDVSTRLRPLMESFVQNCVPAQSRLRVAEPIREVQGWPLDLGEGAWRASAPGLLAVGDAASFVDPLTGEGIGTAMRSSEMAAATALEALAARNFSRRFLSRYDSAWRLRLGTDFLGGCFMKKLMAHRGAAETIIRRASHDHIIAALLGGMVAGALPKWMAWNPIIIARLLLGRMMPFPMLQARGR